MCRRHDSSYKLINDTSNYMSNYTRHARPASIFLLRFNFLHLQRWKMSAKNTIMNSTYVQCRKQKNKSLWESWYYFIIRQIFTWKTKSLSFLRDFNFPFSFIIKVVSVFNGPNIQQQQTLEHLFPNVKLRGVVHFYFKIYWQSAKRRRKIWIRVII